MPFMVPEYLQEPFVIVNDAHGESHALPWDCFSPGDFAAKRKGEEGFERLSIEYVHDGWWCRLSAPGYMDATDWSGPYATEAEAQEAIQSQYDVDPESGESLDPDADVVPDNDGVPVDSE